MTERRASEWIKRQKVSRRRILSKCFPLEFDLSFYRHRSQRNGGWPLNHSLERERQKVESLRVHSLSVIAIQ